VVRHLHAGGLIACPTETVYGFGCAPDPGPLQTLVGLKQRESAKPFLLLVLDAEQVAGAEWTDAARALAAAFWPGPLTLALAVPASAALAEGLRGPEGTIAVRATSHAGMRALLQAFGRPITSTSANLRGQMPALDAEGVRAVLDTFDGEGAIIVLDGGRLPPSPPSTIVDCSVLPPRLVRDGAIARADLKRVVHDIDTGESGARAR
jgi:L-threonylcarbamoyladenylate synthase